MQIITHFWFKKWVYVLYSCIDSLLWAMYLPEPQEYMSTQHKQSPYSQGACFLEWLGQHLVQIVCT